jgi:hypothetical protein
VARLRNPRHSRSCWGIPANASSTKPSLFRVRDYRTVPIMTLIACEKMGRSSRLMELDPKYCDVIVKRWQDFTGKAAHLEDGRTFAELETLHQIKRAA